MKNQEPNSQFMNKNRKQKSKSFGYKLPAQDQSKVNQKLPLKKTDQELHERRRNMIQSSYEAHQISINSACKRQTRQKQFKKSIPTKNKQHIHSHQNNYEDSKGNENGNGNFASNINGKAKDCKQKSFQTNQHNKSYNLYERKCQTPSLGNYPLKLQLKGKQKHSQRKKIAPVHRQSNGVQKNNNNSQSSMQYYYKNTAKNHMNISSIKRQSSKQRLNRNNLEQSSRNQQMHSYQYDNQQNTLMEKQFQSSINAENKSKKSPFKHRKDRPISNLANARHAKHIQHQLSNLNDSIMKNQASFLHSNINMHESLRKNDIHLLKLLQDGKKLMKINQFQKAANLYQDMLSSDKKKPQNMEVLYLFGVCKYHLEFYLEAIKIFKSLLLKDDHYRKNVYLFLAISYKKTNQVDQSLLTLTKAIAYYPKYYDALILRAKILSKQKRYYDSIEDLNKCIKIQPKNLQAYTYKADCLRSIGQFSDAVQIYNEILNLTYDGEILLKRAITFIQFNQIQKALNDLNKIISKNPINSEAYVFKGQAFTKTKNYNDAILAYEQAIKYNSSKRATTKALHQISKLKIDMGDFYGAAYNMERASSLEVDQKILEKLKAFTEGSTLIMKKKYKKGIENMNFLMKKQHISQQIKPLIYSFRSYAYFCQYKFSNSLNDLKNLLKMGYKLDSSSQYNQNLLEGIIACQKNNFSEARQKFETAAFLRNSFADPLIYQALTNVCQYNRSGNTNFKRDKTQRQQQKQTRKMLLKEAIYMIKQSLMKQQNSNSFYILSCVFYTIGQFEEALNFLQKAIDKSDDHVMKHFYLRALIKGMMGKYEEALTDFNNVLTLAKDSKDKLKERNQRNSRQQRQAAYMYEIDEPQQQKQILEAYLNRAKCYLLFDNKKKAFQDLQTYISCKPLDSQIHTVAGKLLFSIGACQDAVKAYNYSPNIDKSRQILLERVKCYIVLKQLNLCLKDMEKMIDLGDNLIRFDFCCLSALKEASKNTLQSYKEALNKISLVDSLGNSIQNGHIFKSSDMLFYKGLFNFLIRNYEDSLRLFTQSKNIKAQNKQLIFLSSKNKPQASSQKHTNYLQQEQRFQNNIYCCEQIQFNIAICELMLGNHKNATKTLLKFDNFEKILKNTEQGLAQESAQQQNDTKIDITPFPITNRLCSIFPKIPVSSQKYTFGLSFCLPTVLPPEIKFEVQNKIIEDLNMSSTEARPDAPWIKRNSFGVIFTDEVIGFDIDINTEKSSLKDLHEHQGNAIKIENFDQDNQLNEQNTNVENKQCVDSDEEQFQRKMNTMNRRSCQQKILGQDFYQNNFGKQEDQSTKKANIKQFLALDTDIQAKLAKLMKKNNKQ